MSQTQQAISSQSPVQQLPGQGEALAEFQSRGLGIPGQPRNVAEVVKLERDPSTIPQCAVDLDTLMVEGKDLFVAALPAQGFRDMV